MGGRHCQQVEVGFRRSVTADRLVDREHSEKLSGAVAGRRGGGPRDASDLDPRSRGGSGHGFRGCDRPGCSSRRWKYVPWSINASSSRRDHSSRGSVRPSNPARADSQPCTVTTSKPSQAGRCRLITTILKPTASASSEAMAGSASDPGRVRATRATLKQRLQRTAHGLVSHHRRIGAVGSAFEQTDSLTSRATAGRSPQSAGGGSRNGSTSASLVTSKTRWTCRGPGTIESSNSPLRAR